MREYSYRCHDFSLLTPGFKKWFVSPLLPLVPWAIPANIVTIFSNIFVYIGFFISLYYNNPWSRITVAACLLLYLIGDHLDGMQAKRTGTGSALGEFCDHYLDAFNNGIILFTAFQVFTITNVTLIAVVLSTAYLAHMAVFYEQLKTGWLTFEKLGSLEAVLLILLLIGLSSIEPIYIFFTKELFASWRAIDIMFSISAIGSILTFFTTISRTPNKGREIWFFFIGLFIIALFSARNFDTMELFILITLYASLYIGLIMKGHLVDGIERLPDLVVPGTFLIVQFFQRPNSNIAFDIFSIYLIVRILILVVQTFSTLKIFWIWSNPRT